MLFRIYAVIAYVLVVSKPTHVTCVYIPRYMRLKGYTNRPSPELIDNCPHRVAILSENNLFVGSATIIGDIWAVTSAQTVYNRQNLTLRAGSSCWAFRGNLHNVTHIIIHPEFGFTDPPNATYYHDIAVLRVNRKFDERRHAQPIMIAKLDAKVGQQAKLSNWGRQKRKDGTYQWSNLVVIDVDTIYRRVCKVRYPELTRGMICYREKSRNIFPPDKGSAYVVHDTLAGIMSYGREPYDSKSFNIVTNVPAYRLWINYVISKCRKSTNCLPGTTIPEDEGSEYLDEFNNRTLVVRRNFSSGE